MNLFNNDSMFEMACLRKNKTWLPVNIYVNDSGSWKESVHAIKFQNNKGDKPIIQDMIPMSIEDNPKILVLNQKMELLSADINAIKKFVIDNKTLLEQLGNTDIDIEDFIKKMIRQ